jgi:acetoin utilization deacetylase AcuC-like enzyme
LKISSVENDKDNEGNTEFKIIKKLDADTIMTLGSWEAACGAAGCGLAAVDAVCSGATRSAFCAIRPPGHHVGTFGPCQPPNFNTLHDHLISCENEEDWLYGLFLIKKKQFKLFLFIRHGSQGFCLLNNVAIAAAYARFKYSEQGIRRIAIVDFDIHHGNGTQQIVLNLRPRVRNLMVRQYKL